MMRPATALIAVAALLGAGTAAATVVAPNASTPAPVSHDVPVTSASLACPLVQSETAKTRVSAAVAAVDAPGLVSPVLVGPLGDPKAAHPLLTKPYMAKSQMGDGPDQPWRVDVRGPLAAGAAADQLTRVTEGEWRGLATANCTAPTTEAWFAGFATDVGQHSRLVLTNIDDVAAVVHVDVWGQGGPVSGGGAMGVMVEPHKQTSMQLDELAPGLSVGALHVTTSAGRVAAAVNFGAQEGSLPLGTDWVPATQGPARNLVVPGLVAGEGNRSLVLAVPGEVDADVTLRIVRPDGSFAPEDAPPVTVGAGSVVSVDLSQSLEGHPGAVVLSSTEPVVAGAVQSVPGAGGTSDVTFSAAALPLSTPAVVPGNQAGPGQQTILQLTAPDTDAAVTVHALPRDGSAAATKHLQIPAGTTQAFDVAGLTHDPHASLVVVPDKGSVVYGSRVLFDVDPRGSWTMVSSSPLTSVTMVRTVRAATPSLGEGLAH
jgi:hypothetical protein